MTIQKFLDFKSKKYRIKLKRYGRHQKPYYKIVVVNRSNRIVQILGSINLFDDKKNRTIYIDKLLLLFWLNNNATCSIIIYKLFYVLFI